MYKSLMALACVIAIASTASAKLEVYLPMNGNLNDYSGNGNNGVLVDGVAGIHGYTTGMVGDCLDLGLSEQELPNVSTLTTGGDYVSIDYTLPDEGSISLWYLTTDPNYSYESLWDNSLAGDNWECWIQSNGRVKFRASDVWIPENIVEWDLDDLNPNYSPNTYEGEWLHFALTWKKLTDTTMEMALYVNGVQRAFQGASAWTNPGDTFFLGGGNDANTYGIGAFDELGIWNNALTETQVMGVYTNGIPLIPGDANNDGKVDGSDVTILAGNWQVGVGGVGGASWSMGDFNGDGAVDGSDVTILAGNWQHGVTAAAASVPEPGTMLLLLSAIGSLLIWKRRK